MNMLSKLIRRTHMYLALFLTPWMLMYALSTMAMNHRAFFRAGPPAFETEREQRYEAAFASGATPRQIARQILHDLGMDGAHNVSKPAADGRLTILRLDPVTPRRIVYAPADRKLIIEREVFRAPAFLERMHRRRGFQHDYTIEDTWAFSVDLVIVAMVFWAASGLWMWWEMRATRRTGALFAAGGLALFGLFLIAI